MRKEPLVPCRAKIGEGVGAVVAQIASMAIYVGERDNGATITDAINQATCVVHQCEMTARAP